MVRSRKGPRLTESPLSPQYILRATMAFLGFIAFAGIVSVALSKAAKSGQAAQVLKKYSEQTIYHQVEEIPDSILRGLDVVIVLGGGAPKALEEPPLFTQERCDFAAQVVLKRRQHGSTHQRRKSKSQKTSADELPILSLSAGTAHVPQLLSQVGLPVWESTASSAYLRKHYNLSSLYVETTSYDTIGNAFYTRTTHTDLNGWRNLLIITSEFHMPRTKAIFDWIMLSLEPTPKGSHYKLFYLASKNSGLNPDALEARVAKEKKSLEMIVKFANKYRTLPDVYDFMTHEHDLYTAVKLVERAKSSGTALDDLTKKSYGGDSS